MKMIEYEIIDLPKIAIIGRRAYAQKKRTWLRICGRKLMLRKAIEKHLIV